METGITFYCQPMTLISKSGINLKVWAAHALDTYNAVGVTSGPFFCVLVKGVMKQASVADLDEGFHSILQRIQRLYPRVIPPHINVEDDYSIHRSICRGSTTEAQNANIPKEVIEANNRWRKRERARDRTPGMSMMERYSEARASVLTLVRYSAGL
mmetsp:Transcript_12348/g.17595  ORF Transcript_12348/g.17595 Transcript_12348/m.17595 type:complete len:156 (-) Transcript_12348:2255-2722(-)